MAEPLNTGLSAQQVLTAFDRALNDYTDAEIDALLGVKQDNIPDLAAIRSGAAAGLTAVQPADMSAALAVKQDKLTFDSAPTESSTNPVTSGGVWTDQQRQDALEAEDRAALVALVDGGDKNLFNIFATPTAYHASYTISGNTISAVATDYYARLAFPCVFKSGKNVFKCTVSNRVVVGGNMQIRFSKNADASGSLSNSITIAQNGDVYSEISVSADTNGYITFYLNASGTSYGNSADFSEIMLCTAADYAISPAFVPYRPSWQEMWEMIQALQNGA